MMEGVTVLCDYGIHCDWGNIIGGALLALLGSALIFALLVFVVSEHEWCGIIPLCFIGLPMLIFGIALVVSAIKYPVHKQKITIADDVPYSYIEEHYNVVDHEGVIYDVEVLDDNE